MFLTVLVAIWCVVLCVWFWIRPKNLEVEPPTCPGRLPVIGHAHKVVGLKPNEIWNLEKMVYKFSSDNGGVAKVSIGPYQLFFLTDPDDCLFAANTCFDKPVIYEIGKEMYGRGLITAKPRTWKLHRKLLNPAFNQKVICSFMDEYCRAAKKLVAVLEGEAGRGVFSIRRYFYHSTMSIAYHTTLGIGDPDASESIKQYARTTHDIFLLYYKKMKKKIWSHLLFNNQMSSLEKIENELMRSLQNITSGVIKNRKELKQNNLNNNIKTEKQNSILDYMLKLVEEQNAFNDEEIREHLDTIMAAALDTTSTALTYALILIGSYPEVQERIFTELKEVFGPQNRDLSTSVLSKLVYLEAVVKETLRLYTPIPRVARQCHSKLKLKNYTLPAGSLLVLSLYGINRHPMWGPNANEFKPERWLNPDSLPTNRNAFASFSLGKRNCIGKVYAMMVTKTVLAYILQKYKVTGDISKVKEVCDLLVTPVAGHHISLELRK